MATALVCSAQCAVRSEPSLSLLSQGEQALGKCLDFTGGRAGSEQRQGDEMGLWSCETSRDAHAIPDTAGACRA